MQEPSQELTISADELKVRELDVALGFLFSDISRLRVLIYDRSVAHLGLTFPQVLALGHLLKHGNMTQSTLAQRMDLGAVTISGLIDRLEQRGWVRREASPSDRRAKIVCLTDKVKTVQNEMSELLSDLNDLTLAGLDRSQVENLIGMLRVARRNLRSHFKET